MSTVFFYIFSAKTDQSEASSNLNDNQKYVFIFCIQA